MVIGLCGSVPARGVCACCSRICHCPVGHGRAVRAGLVRQYRRLVRSGTPLVYRRRVLRSLGISSEEVFHAFES